MSCIATTKLGKPCKNKQILETNFCHSHKNFTSAVMLPMAPPLVYIPIELPQLFPTNLIKLDVKQEDLIPLDPIETTKLTDSLEFFNDVTFLVESNDISGFDRKEAGEAKESSDSNSDLVFDSFIDSILETNNFQPIAKINSSNSENSEGFVPLKSLISDIGGNTTDSEVEIVDYTDSLRKKICESLQRLERVEAKEYELENPTDPDSCALRAKFLSLCQTETMKTSKLHSSTLSETNSDIVKTNNIKTFLQKHSPVVNLVELANVKQEKIKIMVSMIVDYIDLVTDKKFQSEKRILKSLIDDLVNISLPAMH